MVDLFSDKKIKLCCDWDRCTCDCSNLNEIRSLARKGEIGWDVFESHLNELRIYDGLLPSLIRAHNSDIFDVILMSELPDKILKKSAEYLKVPFNGIYGYYSFWKKKQHFPGLIHIFLKTLYFQSLAMIKVYMSCLEIIMWM